eukprot:853084-Rhodomonas_salina.1
MATDSLCSTMYPDRLEKDSKRDTHEEIDIETERQRKTQRQRRQMRDESAGTREEEAEGGKHIAVRGNGL